MNRYQSLDHVAELFPASAISGLGLLQVCGRMRVPSPAIGIAILIVSDMHVFLPSFVVL